MHTNLNWGIPMLTLRMFAKVDNPCKGIMRYQVSTPLLSFRNDEENAIPYNPYSNNVIPLSNLSIPKVISMDIRYNDFRLNGISLNNLEAITSNTQMLLITLECDGITVECFCHRLYFSFSDRKEMSGYGGIIISPYRIYCIHGKDAIEVPFHEILQGEKKRTVDYEMCEKLFSKRINTINNWISLKSIQAYGDTVINGYKKNICPSQVGRDEGKIGLFSDSNLLYSEGIGHLNLEDIFPSKTNLEYDRFQISNKGQNNKRAELFPQFDPYFSGCRVGDHRYLDACISESFKRTHLSPYKFLVRTSIAGKWFGIDYHQSTRSHPWFVRGEGCYQECEETTERISATIHFPSISDLLLYLKKIDSLGYKISDVSNNAYFTEGWMIVNKPINIISEELELVFVYDKEIDTVAY